MSVLILLFGGCLLIVLRLAPAKPQLQSQIRPLSRSEMESCGACHENATHSFLASRHHDTLHRGSSERVVARFAGQRASGGNGFLAVEYLSTQKSDKLLVSVQDRPSAKQTGHQLIADWIFGSGNRAYTAVTLKNEPTGCEGLIEHDQTLYALSHLGVTVGHTLADTQSKSLGPDSHPLGLHHSVQDSKECFNCHGRGAAVDTAGRLRLDQFEPLLGCDSCHPGSRKHLESEGSVISEIALTDTRANDQIESCGQCHRTAADVRPLDRDVKKVHHLRFQPVGLQLSDCFSNGRSGLRCTTCHDAHHADQPAEVRRRSIESCLQCHEETSTRACPRKAGTNANSGDKDCLSCHMPEVDFFPNVRFTDHWIRIRQAGEPAVASTHE